MIGSNPGVKFPQDPTGQLGKAYRYTITFNNVYSDIRIQFVDLDIYYGSPAETVKFNTNGGATLPSSVTGGQTLLNPNSLLIPTVANADGTVYWDQPTSSISFVYHRKGGGYALIIDKVEVTKSHLTIASIEPVNHIGYDWLDSKKGVKKIPRFCKNDILANGSASMFESNYTLELTTFDLSNWSVGSTPIYSGLINGQAPNIIDVINNQVSNSPSLVVGQVYALKLITHGCWDSDFMFFTVEECCPDELELAVDCETGEIVMTNLPAGITGLTTQWFYHQNQMAVPVGKLNGYETSIFVKYGTYSAGVSFTLPNGISCNLNTTIQYTPEFCCEQLGPTLNAEIVSHIVGYEAVLIPDGWVQEFPVVDCDGFRLLLSPECFDVAPTTVYIDVQYFDPFLGQAVSGGPNGTYALPGMFYSSFVYPHISTNLLLNFDSDTWYMMTICYGSNCEYIVFKTNNCDETPENGRVRDSVDDELSMIIEPNPVSETVVIEMSVLTTGNLIIRSTEGKIVFTEELVEEKAIKIDMSDYSKGMYFVEITTEDERVSKQLIKN
jgi:hypothetical protein